MSAQPPTTEEPGNTMNAQNQQYQTPPDDYRAGGYVVVGPDGRPVAADPVEDGEQAADPAIEDPSNVAEMVEQPAKVMRIGSMIKQLLEEVRAAPLDEASRARLKEIHKSSIAELEKGLAP